MTDTDAIIESLVQAGEVAGDITPAVYASYFAACPESRELMSHVDQYMQGRMLAEVLRLLMGEEAATDASYLHFETHNHASYGVKQHMYTNLLLAVRDAVRGVLGDDWHPRHESAWQARVEELLAEIDTALATPAS